MWPFNRNKEPINTKVPPEVKQYYSSEHRERVGLAWIIAFVSLVITIAVVMGLFFGGRWAYRKIAHNNPTVAQPQTITSQPATSSPKASSSTAAPKSSKPSTGSSNTSSTSTTTPSQPPVSTNKGQLPAPATSQAQTSGITNTGPGETVATFIIVSLIGTVAYQAYLRRKLVSA